MILTDDQLYAVIRQAGFDPAKMVQPGVSVPAAVMAVALRESAGNPYAFNGNELTRDRSRGLLQINLMDADTYADVKPALPVFNGTVLEEALFNPLINAQAGFMLTKGGNVELMNVAWYILRAGTSYQSRWLAMLPRAQAAEARYVVHPATAL